MRITEKKKKKKRQTTTANAKRLQKCGGDERKHPPSNREVVAVAAAAAEATAAPSTPLQPPPENLSPSLLGDTTVGCWCVTPAYTSKQGTLGFRAAFFAVKKPEGALQHSLRHYRASKVFFSGDRHQLSAQRLTHGLVILGWVSVLKNDREVLVLVPPGGDGRLERDISLHCNGAGKPEVIISYLSTTDEILERAVDVVHTSLAVHFARHGWAPALGYFHKRLTETLVGDTTTTEAKAVDGIGIRISLSSNCKLESGVWEVLVLLDPVVHSVLAAHSLLGNRNSNCALPNSDPSNSTIFLLPHGTSALVCASRSAPTSQEGVCALERENRKRGYVSSPTTTSDFLSFWRETHLFFDCPREFDLVDVALRGGHVRTYPSWAILLSMSKLRGQTRSMGHQIVTDSLCVLMNSQCTSLLDAQPLPSSDSLESSPFSLSFSESVPSSPCNVRVQQLRQHPFFILLRED